jgi:hypothetical protein
VRFQIYHKSFRFDVRITVIVCTNNSIGAGTLQILFWARHQKRGRDFAQPIAPTEIKKSDTTRCVNQRTHLTDQCCIACRWIVRKYIYIYTRGRCSMYPKRAGRERQKVKTNLRSSVKMENSSFRGCGRRTRGKLKPRVEMGLSLSLCGGAAGERVAFFFTRAQPGFGF